MIKLLFLFLLLFVISSCSSSKPSIYRGGNYADKHIRDNQYLVVFSGDEKNNVHKMLYIRCSELALQKGFKYFVVLKQEHTWEKLKMDLFITLSTTYKYGNFIQLVESPVAGVENFDAHAIYHGHLKSIGDSDT